MVRSRDEILNALRSVLGEENVDDNALSLLDDVTDTINDLETKASGSINVKDTPEYKELEQTWRKRYRDRFFAAVEDDPDDPDDRGNPQPDDTPKTFDQLFTVKE